MSRSLATPAHKALTPEQLVVRNIETLLKARGISQAELGKRMSAIGFHAWWHEKTVRNVLSLNRSIKVDELAGLAVALVVTIENLLDERLEDEPLDVVVGPYPSLYPNLVIKDRPQIRIRDTQRYLWSDILDIPPIVHADWGIATWSGDPDALTPPPLQQEPKSRWDRMAISTYKEQGWAMPGPEGELTEEDLGLMNKAIAEWIASKGEIEPASVSTR